MDWRAGQRLVGRQAPRVVLISGSEYTSCELRRPIPCDERIDELLDTVTLQVKFMRDSLKI